MRRRHCAAIHSDACEGHGAVRVPHSANPARCVVLVTSTAPPHKGVLVAADQVAVVSAAVNDAREPFHLFRALQTGHDEAIAPHLVHVQGAQPHHLACRHHLFHERVVVRVPLQRVLCRERHAHPALPHVPQHLLRAHRQPSEQRNGETDAVQVRAVRQDGLLPQRHCIGNDVGEQIGQTEAPHLRRGTARVPELQPRWRRSCRALRAVEHLEVAVHVEDGDLWGQQLAAGVVRQALENTQRTVNDLRVRLHRNEALEHRARRVVRWAPEGQEHVVEHLLERRHTLRHAREVEAQREAGVRAVRQNTLREDDDVRPLFQARALDGEGEVQPVALGSVAHRLLHHVQQVGAVVAQQVPQQPADFGAASEPLERELVVRLVIRRLQLHAEGLWRNRCVPSLRPHLRERRVGAVAQRRRHLRHEARLGHAALGPHGDVDLRGLLPAHTLTRRVELVLL
eukprot:PhM_4_TR18466/c0_g1_i1/m.77162